MMTPYGGYWRHDCIKCGVLVDEGTFGCFTADEERRRLTQLKGAALSVLCEKCEGKDESSAPAGPVLPAVHCSQCKKEVYSARELHELAPMYDRLLEYRESKGRLCKECNPNWGDVMTVAELMANLSSLPPDAVVVVMGDTGPDGDKEDEYKLTPPKHTLLTKISLDPKLLDADDSWYKQDGKSGLAGVIIM